MIPTRTAPPTGEVVTLDEVRDVARVQGFTDDDALLQSFIATAVDRLDGYSGTLGRCLLTQTWLCPFASWSVGILQLPFPDVSEVHVRYIDPDGQEAGPVASENYELVEMPLGAQVRFTSSFGMPALSANHAFPVRVSVTAGYGLPADVPMPIRSAIKMMVSDLYNGTRNGRQIDDLLAPYRAQVI
jgi:uncharacterized phiE125 gp8 family phage protein